MEMDLNARSAKWKREQDKAKERARRQKQTEALKRAAAEKAQRELEELQTLKRLERLREQERREQEALEEQRLTGGIKYLRQLRPTPTTGDGDKITLPVSALEELNPQNAFDLGVFTFELSAAGSRTHAGVLEFVAEEGTVGLPPKVAASLFPRGAVPETVQVRFVRLEKGKFVSLQPRGDGFGAREIDMKKILERSLKAHTTLSVGDSLFVRHGRETFDVAVVALQPEPAVNILNTDLEVALLPSESVAKAKEAERAKAEAAARAEELAREKARLREERLAALAPEPPVEERMQAKVVLRMPDGTQATRRVAHSSPLRLVFDLIAALTVEDAALYQVVATYPRRVFAVDAADKTLRELGLNGRQESLFVERVASAEPVDSTTETADESARSTDDRLPVAWAQAKRALEQALDEALYTNAATPIHALEPVMPVAHHAQGDSKWQAQLKELEAMGFTNRELNVQVLERYQGRLLRVVNYLSEMAADPAPTAMEAE
ncbi:hypothetical protein ATCC90586_007596 [Pythium insidiosum]|nr:hypothetical protein ATCC90586_007596 [Pythium insidiosum]